MKDSIQVSVAEVVSDAARRVWRHRSARLTSLVLIAWIIVCVTDRVSSLHANQSRAPYKIASVNQALLVTIVDVELQQAASLPEMKAFGASIAAQRAPHRHTMINFYQGHRGEGTLLASYQDGNIYLSGEYGRNDA